MTQQILPPALLRIYQISEKRLKRGQTSGPNTWNYLNGLNIPQKDINDMHPRSKSIKESTLETEGPLSEKDEVKKAEQRTMEQQKKVDKNPLKKDKK